ncbi:WD40-repeat-containing domain protein [Zopfochytrium polystomum]|nr:WD40-repeat-containing domain protein [Zopfochytrium polystomum]
MNGNTSTYRDASTANEAADSTPQHKRSGQRRHRKSKRSSSKSRSRSRSASRASRRSARDDDLIPVSEGCKVKIARSDPLLPDARVLHPFVRVHIVDKTSGEYFLKPKRVRAVSALETSLDFVLPFITKSFSLVAHKTLKAAWNEDIFVNVEFSDLVERNALLLFEVLDIDKTIRDSVTSDGWLKVAWAFILLSEELVNTGELRLQLYEYPEVRQRGPQKSPRIYTLWSQKNWKKYPSSLYVRVESFIPHGYRLTTERPKLPTEIEVGKLTFEQLMDDYLAQRKQDPEGDKSAAVAVQARITERRSSGDFCKPPNSIFREVATGRSGSMACAFSYKGDYFAVACAGESDCIRVYRNYNLLRPLSISGHCGLIHDLCWAPSESHNTLCSASADGSARLWIIPQAKLTAIPCRVFSHPCFVFCCQMFKIWSFSYIVTGGSDGIVRVWAISEKVLDGSGAEEEETRPTQLCVGHRSRVNCVAVDSAGARIYSGDGEGILRVWSRKAHVTQSEYECIKVISVSSAVKSLSLHVTGRQILVFQENSVLHSMDTRIYKSITAYNGLRSALQEGDGGNVAEQTEPRTAIYSPCGAFVYGGLADGNIFVWNTSTGSVVGLYSQLGLSGPFSRIAFHPNEHVVAFTAWGARQPASIMYWAKDKSRNFIMVSNLAIEERLKIRQQRSSTIDKWLETRRKLLWAKQDKARGGNDSGISRTYESNTSFEERDKEALRPGVEGRPRSVSRSGGKVRLRGYEGDGRVVTA